MTDTDVTRKRHHVADPLREYAESTALLPGMSIREVRDELQRLADQIDRDHERRMDQAREDSRKATCNYMSRIIADYKRGKKWKRKDYPNG
jgi:hypothetical protein